MLLNVKLEKLAMRAISIAIAILRIRVGGAIFLGSEQFLVGTLLKLNKITFGKRRRDTDHFLGYLDIALMITTDLSNNFGYFHKQPLSSPS